jgi:hypothetical protein
MDYVTPEDEARSHARVSSRDDPPRIGINVAGGVKVRGEELSDYLSFRVSHGGRLVYYCFASVRKQGNAPC